MTPEQLFYWQSLIALIERNSTKTINVGSSRARATLLAINELLADELKRREKQIMEEVKAGLMRP